MKERMKREEEFSMLLNHCLPHFSHQAFVYASKVVPILVLNTRESFWGENGCKHLQTVGDTASCRVSLVSNARWVHREGLRFALHPQLQRPFSHRVVHYMPYRSDNWLQSVPQSLCNIALENTTLYKPWEDSKTETYSQGQNNTVPIASFDDKVFPTQTIWIYIYIMFKPKSQIKNQVWINKLQRKPKRNFGLSAFLGILALDKLLSWRRLPYLHWLYCTGKAEGRLQRAGTASIHGQKEQHMSAN